MDSIKKTIIMDVLKQQIHWNSHHHYDLLFHSLLVQLFVLKADDMIVIVSKFLMIRVDAMDYKMSLVEANLKKDIVEANVMKGNV